MEAVSIRSQSKGKITIFYSVSNPLVILLVEL